MRLSRVLLFALIALACHGLAAAKPVVIRFQYWGGLEEIPSIERIVRDFNAAHPNIRVVAQRAPGALPAGTALPPSSSGIYMGKSMW